MVLAKLALRIDGRFLLAAFGLAAAMLVPLAGVLATAGLQPTIGGGQGTLLIAKDADGLSNGSVERATWVLAGRDDAAGHLVAYVKGDSLVKATQAYDGGPAGRTLAIDGRNLTTVALTKGNIGPGLILVHPSVLGPAARELAGFTKGPGTPLRGNDAFEAAGITSLKGYTAALTIVSLPLVILVASAFARLEARSLSNAVAVISALGRPERAGQVLTARALLLAAVSSALALLVTVGGVTLDLLPGNRNVLAGRGIAIGLAIPAFAAAVAGAAVGWSVVLRTRALLRERPSLGGEARLGFLPVAARPMVTGWKLVGILVLVGAVVALDVGLPLAAAGVPAALAGEHGEWVFGVQGASITAGRVNEGPALVMGHDPAIDAIVAEVFVPTVVQGKPFVLRGGSWIDLAHYHGLRLVSGNLPGPGEVVLGDRGAGETHLHVGDAFYAPGEGGRVARLTVSGTYTGGGLLADEGILRQDEAQRLAGLPAGIVHAIRVHPQSPAALSAMHRDAPDLQVLGLDVVPSPAPAGSIATVAAPVVNLSGSPGTRVLNLRIDGEVVDTATVTLPGYGQRTVEMTFIVPPGTYDVKVNPETSGTGSTATRALQAPTGVVAGRSFDVTVTDGGQPAGNVTVGLFANGTAAASGAPLASAATDAQGHARLTMQGSGLRLVSVLAGTPAAAQVYGITTADSTRTRIVVEAAYTTPAQPVAGQAATVYAHVRNVGGVAGSQRLPFTMDGQQRGYKDVHLQPGEAAMVSLDYVPQRTGETVKVLGFAVTTPVASKAPGPVVVSGNGTPGESLQSQVADRLLGNARAVLGGLAATAAVSAVAVLLLSSRRTLAARGGIVAVLATIWTPDEIRRRAAVEGAILGALGGAGGVLLAKGFLVALTAWTTVRAFGHALGDPFSLVFMLQVAGTTAFLTSLTLYNGVGKRVGGSAAKALRAADASE